MKLVITGATGFMAPADRSPLGPNALAGAVEPQTAGRSQCHQEGLAGVGAGNWRGVGENIDGADGIINLAGEPIAAKRWSEAQKEKLRSSRIDSTRSLIEAIGKAKIRPKFMISASAVGYYGAHGDETVTEATGPEADFLARLCLAWEQEALKAESLGVRVALVRTGIVLDKGKGALAKMVPPFKMFVGGPLGSGAQWMPWVHIADEIGLILFLIENEKARGAFNSVAPNPVTNEIFSRTLGSVLGRPSWASVPAGVLSLLTGEMADMLLAGQRAVPQAALDLGYSFKYPNLADALRSLRL